MNNWRQKKIKLISISIICLAFYIYQNNPFDRDQFAVFRIFPYKSASFVCTATHSKPITGQIEPALSYINTLPAEEYGKVVERFYREDLKDVPENLKNIYSYESVNKLEDNFAIELQLSSAYYNRELADKKYQLFRKRVQDAETRAFSDVKTICNKGLRLVSNSLDNYMFEEFRHVNGFDAVEIAILLIYFILLGITFIFL